MRERIPARRAPPAPVHPAVQTPVRSPVRSTRLPNYFAALYAMMIVYASLLPLSDWMLPLAGTPFFLFAPWPPRYTRFDVAINVVAYLPFGLAVAMIGARTPTGIRIARAAAVGALLALCMESAQMFVPTRDASTIDLISNTLGATLGGALAAAYCAVPSLRARTGAWRRR